jgi:hypothetical protein
VSEFAAGNVTLDFSGCFSLWAPRWVAAQDGDGDWTRLSGRNDVYRFNVTSGRGGYAAGWDDEYRPRYLEVRYGTQVELTAAPITECVWPKTRWVMGVIRGLTAAVDVANISMAQNANGRASSQDPSFKLINVPMSIEDLVVYRTTHGGPGVDDRIVIIRDQDGPEYGSSVGIVDVGANSGFAVVPAPLTVLGTESGERFATTMTYRTGANCSDHLLYSSPGSSPAPTMYGVSAAQQRADDYHAIEVGAFRDSISFRSVVESFHTLAQRTVTLPSPLAMPAVSSLSSTAKRLQATVTIPADYRTAEFRYWLGDYSTSGSITATSGWVGAGSATLAVPDFTDVVAISHWLPLKNQSVDWSLTVTGSNVTSGTPCFEGSRSWLSRVTGRH